MAKLTYYEKKEARELCRKRDGDKCSDPTCNKSGEVYRKEAHRDFDLHHKDRNPENNPKDGSNHALMCHSCNCKADPRGRRKQPYFSKFRNLKEYYKSKGMREGAWRNEEDWKWAMRTMKSPTMQKNEECELPFREAARELIGKFGRMKRKLLIDSACEKSSCSQATGSRYLDKMLSFYGVLDWEEDKVTGEIIIFRKQP